MSFQYFYVYIMTGICLFIIWKGLKHKQKIFELPFLTAVAFLGFIVPQAIYIYSNPEPVSLYAIDLTVIIGILCLVFCWFSYEKHKPNPSFLEKLDFKISNQNLFNLGCLYIGLGFLFYSLIGELPVEMLNNSQWTGRVTIYIFFAKLVFPGFSLAFIATLYRPSLFRWSICALGAFWPLFNFIFMGRRTVMIAFILSVLSIMFFVRRFMIPTYIIIFSMIVGFFLIPVIGEYRNTVSQLGIGLRNWEIFIQFNWLEPLYTSLIETNWLQAYKNQISQGNIGLELKYAASLVEVVSKKFELGWGTHYWNKLVFGYVPAQLLGEQFKNALMLPSPDFRSLTFTYYGMPTFHTGITTTVIGEVFKEFYFFGPLVYTLFAFFYKNLFYLANYYKNNFYIAIYATTIAYIMVAVVGGLANYLVFLVYCLVFYSPLLLFREKKNKYI